MPDQDADYHGPASYALADWRRRVSDLYGAVRRSASPADGWRLWRRQRDDLFRNHAMSPLPRPARSGFSGLDYFAYDETLRFAVALKPAETTETLDFTLGPDGPTSMRNAALTSGLTDRLGGELTLFRIEGYGGGLFLPFADATSGGQTYGGGRYLLDTIKGADLGLDGDGRIILDFNFAYNPSCSYSPDYVCPLAPAENRLECAVQAGERTN